MFIKNGKTSLFHSTAYVSKKHGIKAENPEMRKKLEEFEELMDEDHILMIFHRVSWNRFIDSMERIFLARYENRIVLTVFSFLLFSFFILLLGIAFGVFIFS